VIIGFGVIYRNKAIHGKAHFTSLHGKMGLVTLLLALLSPLLGAFSFKSLGLIHMLLVPACLRQARGTDPVGGALFVEAPRMALVSAALFESNVVRVSLSV